MYQPNETTVIEVILERETIWLTQQQIADLFQKERSGVTKHISNIFSEGELEEKSNVNFLHIANSDKPVKYFSLDVIISVGYRVKSLQGTRFRIWANKVLKEHLLRGNNYQKELSMLEERIDSKLLLQHDEIQSLRNAQREQQSKIDFFVRTSLPPVEGVFSDGQIFDAYTFACDLIRSAKRRLVLIDNYVDDTVLEMFSKRQAGVDATIYTAKITSTLRLDVARHNAQYPPLTIQSCRNFHDRFLLVDDKVYHIGASLKDLGKRLFAFSLLADFEAGEILSKITI